MKKILKHFSAAIACTAASLTWAQMPAYQPVTDARLSSPEAANWLMYRGNYAGWGYSPLSKINDRNVDRLTLAWAYTTGVTEGHQAPPIVNGRYMYVATPSSQVIALDAKTGNEIWRYKAQLPSEQLQLHPTSRGVALYGDKVYLATTDCKLVALDAKTGKVLWTSKVEEWKNGYYMSLAPLVAKGKVMVGSSGGEMGVRGFIAAFDAETGKEVWRTYTVPAPGEPGSDTWPAGEAYKTGGGPIWVTGTFDAQTGLAYWGTGNPSPWLNDQRPGDNLYTSSMLALDVETGAIKGYHQYQHNDAWDWDEVSAPVLIDTTYKGKPLKAAVHAGRSGILWVLERTFDKVNFVEAWKYVNNNVVTAIDPKTGRLTYDPAKTPGTGKGATFCPGLWGGKDWPPEAYNPDTGMLYVPANNNFCGLLPAGAKEKYKPGDVFIGYPLEGVLGSVRVPNPDQTIGELQAWDMKTGKQAWVHKFNTFLWAPLLTTSGNLVFAGGTNDRMFRAYDAKTGKVLWEFPTPAGVIGVPSSFEVDGEQYIAVQSGWGVDAERIQGAMNAILPERKVVNPQGGSVLVFKIKREPTGQVAGEPGAGSREPG
jgi:alcohol dehydrogenase (cytochrome c)